MKARAFFMISCLILGVLIASCSGKKKVCPAYSKMKAEVKKEVKS